jgi:hypothetical protein
VFVTSVAALLVSLFLQVLVFFSMVFSASKLSLKVLEMAGGLRQLNRAGVRAS